MVRRTNARRGTAYAATMAVAAAAAAWGVFWHGAHRQVPAAGLPDLGAVPAFTLIDHESRPFTRPSLQGSVWIIDFIFTRCAGQCPMLSQRMAALQARLAATPGIRFASISVDPAYDTPAQLRAYAEQYQAGERWVFLTGSEPDVFTLSRDGFHLGVGKDGTPEEPVTHSVRLVLLDRAARIRGYYSADEPEAMRRVEADARRLASSAP